MKKRKMIQDVFLKGISAKGSISRWLIVLAIGLLVLPVLFIACVENNKPGIIYDTSSNITTGDKPVITSIAPATQAIAGIREIKIFGKNLGIKNGTDSAWIFIGGVNPMIKEIIQDSVITIYRPKLSNDHYDKTISVSVTDPKSLALSSSMDYYVESPGAVVGDYTGVTPVTGIDFDKEENLYAAAQKSLYKTDFAGVTQTQVLNSASLLSGDYNSITDIGFGPGASKRNLFIAVGKNYIARQIVLDTLNGNNKPIKITVPAAVSKLDFDDHGNIYTGGSNGIFKIDTVTSTSATADTSTAPSLGYEGINIRQIRVVIRDINRDLYVADSMNVWKSPILSDGTLGAKVSLVNLNGTALSACTITSFAVDVNGAVFLCLKNHPKYSLFVQEGDGSITPFYSDPTILPNTVDRLTWGNGKYLYLISGSLQSSPGTYSPGRVYRITLDRNGAAYQGRKFIR